MSVLQALMLLLILSANGIIIPNSVWYCLIAWTVITILNAIDDMVKKKKEKRWTDVL